MTWDDYIAATGENPADPETWTRWRNDQIEAFRDARYDAEQERDDQR